MSGSSNIAETSATMLLRRHARYFVIRSPQAPHALVKGAAIPWNWTGGIKLKNYESQNFTVLGRTLPTAQTSADTIQQARMQNSLPMLVAPYVNMYMARAVAANQKQSADNAQLPSNNMLYPTILNKFNQFNSAANTSISDITKQYLSPDSLQSTAQLTTADGAINSQNNGQYLKVLRTNNTQYKIVKQI